VRREPVFDAPSVPQISDTRQSVIHDRKVNSRRTPLSGVSRGDCQSVFASGLISAMRWQCKTGCPVSASAHCVPLNAKRSLPSSPWHRLGRETRKGRVLDAGSLDLRRRENRGKSGQLEIRWPLRVRNRRGDPLIVLHGSNCIPDRVRARARLPRLLSREIACCTHVRALATAAACRVPDVSCRENRSIARSGKEWPGSFRGVCLIFS